ncbi:hypothetical protein CEXT_572501 [Caerostris extrusa]|uniref:Uncharacterized protein n=1 Tax=Caerostris extrusa TaxID=172846 RepID=A0AAV4VFD0_CAEEX|nr:hypothetical protein CEXT_572501 [Caerostris extrusa]
MLLIHTRSYRLSNVMTPQSTTPCYKVKAFNSRWSIRPTFTLLPLFYPKIECTQAKLFTECVSEPCCCHRRFISSRIRAIFRKYGPCINGNFRAYLQAIF